MFSTLKALLQASFDDAGIDPKRFVLHNPHAISVLDIEEEYAYSDLEWLDELGQQPIYKMCNTDQFIDHH